ncbi:hypothetical protein Taro_056563 [Colocasia esculenta]|uniref:Uncharacterized protein n=1 Tax=Colocasia esculenta TaxID=4460 RepID=A0A843XTU1_COLES|nr:hypothetical protein [Colocasia esculenta]
MEGKEETSTTLALEKEGRSLLISMQEGWQYIKAIFTGQVKKARARTEQEASEADLQTAKRQVEAADSAEEKKKKLSM